MSVSMSEVYAEFAGFQDAFAKYAAGLKGLPMPNFFALMRKAPPSVPSQAKRIATRAARLSPADRAAFRDITTVGETVRPPVWS